jgi:four helix bundle protein
MMLAPGSPGQEKSPVQDFRNLLVWQKAHRLNLEIHALSETLAARHQFHLRDQIVRAAQSVPANIAEGCGRTGDREFRRFVRVALGSASELEYYLLLARDLGLLAASDYGRISALAAEIKRMLSGLATRLSSCIKAES